MTEIEKKIEIKKIPELNIKKISQLNGDELFTTLAKITIPIANITEDEPLINKFIELYKIDKEKKRIDKEKKEKENGIIEIDEEKEKNEYMMQMTSVILRVIPYLYENHKIDLFEIIGAFVNKTSEEIATQNGILLFKQILQLSQDKDLAELFMRREQSEETN